MGPCAVDRSLPDTRVTDPHVGSTWFCFKAFGKDSDTFILEERC